MPDIKFVKSVFGQDLTTVIKARKSPIPLVVEKCIKEIESRGELLIPALPPLLERSVRFFSVRVCVCMCVCAQGEHACMPVL